MTTETAICISKNSVKALIGILNQTISTLKNKGSKHILSESEYEMIIDAQKELNTYKELSKIMDEHGHTTLCLKPSNIKREGHIKIYTGDD